MWSVEEQMFPYVTLSECLQTCSPFCSFQTSAFIPTGFMGVRLDQELYYRPLFPWSLCPRRALPTSPLSRTTRWADSLHPDRKFPMPVFWVKCCQYWPWECHFFPAFSIFLFHSCYHCQSVENYRINVGEGLNLHNLLFVACCCRGGERRDSAFCIQFVCILLEVIGLESSQSFTILALLCMCCRGLVFNDFLCSDLDCSLLANYFSQQRLSSPLLPSPSFPSSFLSLSYTRTYTHTHTHTHTHMHTWEETHYSIAKFRTH